MQHRCMSTCCPFGFSEAQVSVKSSNCLFCIVPKVLFVHLPCAPQATPKVDFRYFMPAWATLEQARQQSQNHCITACCYDYGYVPSWLSPPPSPFLDRPHTLDCSRCCGRAGSSGTNVLFTFPLLPRVSGVGVRSGCICVCVRTPW